MKAKKRAADKQKGKSVSVSFLYHKSAGSAKSVLWGMFNVLGGATKGQIYPSTPDANVA
jgi:hypothetical protein